MSPAAPRDNTLKELEIVLKNHNEPALLIIVQFHRRNQGVGESIVKYVAELRRFSTRCKFDDYLEQALHDRLVFGLRNEGTRKRLLSEADLTLAKALELAQGFEAAEKNAQQFKETEVAVHLVAKPKGVHCQRCGRTNHDGATWSVLIVVSKATYSVFAKLLGGSRLYLRQGKTVFIERRMRPSGLK